MNWRSCSDKQLTAPSHAEPRILVATPYFPVPAGYGGGMSIADQVEQLRDFGVDVNVMRFAPYAPYLLASLKGNWSMYRQTPGDYTHNGISVHVERYITFPNNTTLLLASWQIERRMIRYARKVHPDIIHAHHAIPVGIAAVKVGQKLNIPVVLTVHGSDLIVVPYIASRYHGRVCKALEEATLVIGVSRGMKEVAMTLAPEADVVVHRTGIDLSAFTPEAVGAVAEKPDKSFTVLYLGRLIVDKGVHDLLEGFRSFVKQHEEIDAELIYVGNGCESDRLAARAELDPSLCGRVKIMGPCNHRVVPSLMRMCDVVVIPSYYEGLGMVAVEACASGKPVIASSVGGLREVIADGVNGIVVNPGSPAQIAEALGTMWVDSSRRIEMGKAGRCVAEKEYDVRKNTLTLLGVYRKVAMRQTIGDQQHYHG